MEDTGEGESKRDVYSEQVRRQNGDQLDRGAAVLRGEGRGYDRHTAHGQGTDDLR